MIKRTIHKYCVTYVTVTGKDGAIVPSEEKQLAFASQRELSEEKINVKINRAEKTPVVVTAVTHTEETYGLSYEEFMRHAKKIEKEEEK